MRRRGIGIQGLKKKQDARSQYRQVGEQLAQERLATMEEQMGKFKKSLEDFAFKYKDEIKSDPIFRKHFHEMCGSIGVDPLASNKGKLLLCFFLFGRNRNASSLLGNPFFSFFCLQECGLKCLVLVTSITSLEFRLWKHACPTGPSTEA